MLNQTSWKWVSWNRDRWPRLQIDCLICTDLASRGLDIEQVHTVSVSIFLFGFNFGKLFWPMAVICCNIMSWGFIGYSRVSCHLKCNGLLPCMISKNIRIRWDLMWGSGSLRNYNCLYTWWVRVSRDSNVAEQTWRIMRCCGLYDSKILSFLRTVSQGFSGYS